MFYIKLGLRNLIKNYRRTILTMLTIIIGMIAVIIARGFVDYSMWGLRESMINGGTGHIQIYKEGYNEFGEDKPFDYMIDNYKTVMREIVKIPGIKFFAPRLKFMGIMASEEKSTIVSGFAGFPEKEKELNTMVEMKSQNNFNEENPYGIMIGSGVARKLGVKEGETLTLMSTMKGGGTNAIDVDVNGIIDHSIKEINNMIVLGQLEAMQYLLDIPNSIDRIVIMLDKTEDTDRVVKELNKIMEKYDLEYKTWKDLSQFYFQVKGMYETFLFVIMVIIVSIVIFSIANTMSMNLFERIREIGTIRALGTNKLKVMKIFLSESLLIGVIGGLIGIGLGVIIAEIINILGGINVPPPPGSVKGYHALIRPNYAKIWIYFLIFSAISIIAAFFPAKKAANLSIADALRWL